MKQLAFEESDLSIVIDFLDEVEIMNHDDEIVFESVKDKVNVMMTEPLFVVLLN